MHRTSKSHFLLLPLLIASCTQDQAVDFPPVRLSGGEIRLMTRAQTPREAYDNAFTRLTKYHLEIRDALLSSPQNSYVASANLGNIIEHVSILQTLALEPAASQIAEARKRYIEFRRRVDTNQATGSFLTDLGQCESEFRRNFHPSKTPLHDTFPDEEETLPSSSKPSTTPPPAESVSLPPPPEEAKPEPVVEPARTDDWARNLAAAHPPYWLLHKCWAQLHADLAEAYRQRGDCATPYARLAEVLILLRDAAPEEVRNTAELCRQSYEAANTKTQGFTTLPAGVTAENILSELELVAGVLRAHAEPATK